MGPMPCACCLGACLWLWGAAAAAQAMSRSIFSETFFCQRDAPLSNLEQTLDNEQLFWFSFQDSRWKPRLPDFQAEVQNRTAVGNLSEHQNLCTVLLDLLSNFSDTFKEAQIPEATGVPQVKVFTKEPLQLGKRNTLVCSVSNLFPPSATITWERDGMEVTQWVSTTQIYPVGELEFQLFSYLEMVPQEGDVYSCMVRAPREVSGGMAYWVPKDPMASDLLETIACSVAVVLGIVCMIAGIVLLVKSRKLRAAD